MRRITIIVLSLLIILAFAETFDELIHIGDYFFNRGEYFDALKKYREAERITPESPQILWRIGRAYNRIALNLVDNAQNDTFKIATEYITKSLWVDRNIAESHCEMAWNLTFMGLLDEDCEDFALARRIKEELDFALKLDDDLAEAHFLYGLWHRQVCTISILKRKPNGLGDANKESAEKELKKAVQLNSKRTQYLYEFAVQQLDNGDTTKAIKSFRKATKMEKLPINKPFIEQSEVRLNLLLED